MPNEIDIEGLRKGIELYDGLSKAKSHALLDRLEAAEARVKELETDCGLEIASAKSWFAKTRAAQAERDALKAKLDEVRNKIMNWKDDEPDTGCPYLEDSLLAILGEPQQPDYEKLAREIGVVYNGGREPGFPQWRAPNGEHYSSPKEAYEAIKELPQ